jgi:hypothetical protein
MMTKLTRIRQGPWGTCLFYGYLLAVIIASALALTAIHGLHESDARLNAEILRGQARDVRSCIAIKGAVDFWRKVRMSTVTILSDPNLSAAARRSNEEYLAALTNVIAKGSSLKCEVLK